MPPVSIDEAWGDGELRALSPPPLKLSQPLSARVTTLGEDAMQSTDAAEPEKPVLTVEMVEDAMLRYDIMISELRNIRHEQSRRCTMVFVIIGIMFALLFVYIDRLQQQIRILNSFMVHRQIPTLVGLSPANIQV